MAKQIDLWLIVWYECDDKTPYRISCDYLNECECHWKWATFPDRSGRIGCWKRSTWMGDCLPLDHVIEGMNGKRVKDLVDITPYLVEEEYQVLKRQIAKAKTKIITLNKWRQKCVKI